MTGVCKPALCSSVIGILTLLGVGATVYGIQQVNVASRLDNLESTRDDIVRVITKLENLESSVLYIRNRFDNLSSQGANY
jgi:hypothetical protein